MKKVGKNIVVFVFAFIALAVLLFLSNTATPSKPYIICIMKNMDTTNGFWYSIMEGANLAAAEYGIELSIYGSETEADYEGQNKLILQAIEEKPDAIVLAAADYKKTCEAAKQVKEHNIRLILIDSELEEAVADSVIATDNYGAGIKMGVAIKSILDESSKIGIISHVAGTSTAIEREHGLRTALGEDAEKIVGTYYCNSNYEKAVTITKELLHSNPEVKLLVGLNQYASVGAVRAVKELGLEREIKIIGFDNAREQIKYLEEGIFEAIIVQKSFNMGYLGVEQAVKLIRGEKIERKIDSGCNLVTKENMFTDMNQKLLFPFENSVGDP